MFNNLGYTYFLQQKYPEAIETLEKALALDPRHERSLNNLAQAYTQNGNNEKAAEILARVDALNGKPSAPIMASAQPPSSPTVNPAPDFSAATSVISPPSLRDVSIDPVKTAVQVLPVPSQNLEKISAITQAPLLLNTPIQATSATPLALVVAPTPMQNLEKLPPAERAALVTVAPGIVMGQLSAAAAEAVTSPPSGGTPVVEVKPRAIAEKTQQFIAIAPEKMVGYNVAAELQTEQKSLQIERIQTARAALNNAVAKPVKPESEPSATQTKTKTKAALPENKTSFEKITDAALKELGPNSVKLKAAQDMVAGIFRGFETAFNDLVNGKPFRLEIANGNGVSGLAKKVSDLLVSNGVPAAKITNHKNYQQRQTIIQYRNGYQAQAATLSKGMRNKPQLVQTAKLPVKTDVRLVLGRDVKTQTALFEIGPANMMLASGKDQSGKIE
ncbi:MAG: LytR C-terminal domain-containing protein [Burkholderiales bacterium]